MYCMKRNIYRDRDREMLCIKAEALGHEIYAASGVIFPVNLSRQKTMQKGPHSSSSSSGDGSASCTSVLEDVQSCDGGKGMDKSEKASCYRFHLEQEVRILHKQLQEEIDLHVALINAVRHDTEPLLSPSKIPDKAQDLLANVTALEITVTNLEKELSALHFKLSYERNERRIAETHLRRTPSLALKPPSSISGFMWEEHMSSLRAAKLSAYQVSPSSQSVPFHKLSQKGSREKMSGSRSVSKEENEIVDSLQHSDVRDLKKISILKNHWQHPNKLSEEMVRCMRNIFVCLSESPSTSKVSSSKLLPSFSPVGHLSRSSLTSFSDSSIISSSAQSPTTELYHTCEELDLENSFDPNSVNGKVNWRNIGSYSLAAEVCWMSVGKAQLDYAAEALKKFRFLVEQLTKVDPAQMSSNEKLAFWINLYNALIMHGYLAYGVPRSDIKLFSLMQKASYTVGGQSFSAADIEFVLLKMKSPAHRPQIGLVLALHKFKISEEHRKYSVDKPEPLVVFALSSGMYSSPAVRIFTCDNVHDELKKSMKDYIQASTGISDRGKLVVPKLLHCFARSVVEDSLLVDWICRYLTPDQVTVVRDSTTQKKQRLLGVQSFSIIPFDTRFRYIFLQDNPQGESLHGI